MIVSLQIKRGPTNVNQKMTPCLYKPKNALPTVNKRASLPLNKNASLAMSKR